jgi:hypothetical protein
MFEIIDVGLNPDDLEWLGTKEKFWFLNLSNPEQVSKLLFKYSRENTGEHWSEKIAEELCKCLGIPHANYQIATCLGRNGVITKNLIAEHCRMVMGNEVLHTSNPTQYPKPEKDEKKTRVKEHTVSRVLACLDNGTIEPPESDYNLEELTAGDVFCGYLLLDTLVSNQDRHHENWAIIINNNDGTHSLCPTYDHAACLGRELTDSDRETRLNSKDKNRQIPTFVKKARSELFATSRDKKTLTTIDAFYLSIKQKDKAKQHWISKLDELSNNTIEEIIDNVPADIMTKAAKRFAFAMLIENKKRVLNDERR